MKHLILLTWFFFTYKALFSQRDESYSQYMFNRFLLNPSVATSENMLEGHVFYKNYAPINGLKANLQSFSFQMPLKNNSVGVGVIFKNDVQYQFELTSFLVAGNYKLNFYNGFLSFGLEAGSQLASLTPGGFNAKEENDPFYIQDNRWMFDVGFGLNYGAERWYSGVSFKHLENFFNESSAIFQQYTFYYMGGVLLPLKEDWELIPSLLYKATGENYGKVDVNVHLRFKKDFWIGGSYTSFNEFGVQAGLGISAIPKVSLPMKVGYAFEIGEKANGYTDSISHEIMCSVSIRKKDSFERIKKSKSIITPLFF